jgi:hypothetical protein
MIRWWLALAIVACCLSLVRVLVIRVCEVAERRRIAVALRAAPEEPAVEEKLAVWRDALGRRLWIRLVGIPTLIIFGLVLAAEYS